jgi:hypothetical protein
MLRCWGTDIFRDQPGRKEILFQRAKALDECVAEGFQSLGQYGVIEEKPRCVFQYPQSFPETIQVRIDKSQH